jgi:hypothetical protein
VERTEVAWKNARRIEARCHFRAEGSGNARASSSGAVDQHGTCNCSDGRSSVVLPGQSWPIRLLHDRRAIGDTDFAFHTRHGLYNRTETAGDAESAFGLLVWGDAEYGDRHSFAMSRLRARRDKDRLMSSSAWATVNQAHEILQVLV